MDARPQRSVDWADLELFLAVARGGSLAAAASTLRVDASTVHRRIASLEEALRTRLFARSPRGYALTNAGHELLPYATAMDEQAAAARRKLAGRDEALTGTVRLSAVHDVAAILSPIVASFRAKHPGVTVAVDLRSAFADLARQQADVALRVSTRAPEGDLVAKHVAKLAVAFYASRAYLTSHGRPERVEDLRDHAIVRGDAGQPSLPGERTLDGHSRAERVAFRSQSMIARLAAIRDGLGIGVLGCFMGDREQSLVRLPFAVSDPNVNVWILVHVDLRQNARVRAFSEHTYAGLVAQRPLFEGHSRQAAERRRSRSLGRTKGNAGPGARTRRARARLTE
jgi:DNA-binding transcriptional LysR family regulator